MKNKPISDYIQLQHACTDWKCDFNQLSEIIQKKEMGIFASIKNKIVLERKINKIDDKGFYRLAKQSIKELEAEGFSLIPQSDQSEFIYGKCFRVTNGDTELVMFNPDGKRHVKPPHKYLDVKEIKHDGFIEMTLDRFLEVISSSSPSMLDVVKCEKEGYERYVKGGCLITSHDIYIRNATLSKYRKPSETGKEKSVSFREELQKAGKALAPRESITKRALWKAFIDSVKTNPQSSFIAHGKDMVKDKDDNHIWNYERATYHLDVVANWLNIK